uniref:Uncharacterized protein n=1 Tax=Sphaerodactylus townsendi TaxID=933632 RepID=A0ACB8FCY5_9SAUR
MNLQMNVPNTQLGNSTVMTKELPSTPKLKMSPKTTKVMKFSTPISERKVAPSSSSREGSLEGQEALEPKPSVWFMEMLMGRRRQPAHPCPIPWAEPPFLAQRLLTLNKPRRPFPSETNGKSLEVRELEPSRGKGKLSLSGGKESKQELLPAQRTQLPAEQATTDASGSARLARLSSPDERSDRASSARHRSRCPTERAGPLPPPLIPRLKLLPGQLDELSLAALQSSPASPDRLGSTGSLRVACPKSSAASFLSLPAVVAFPIQPSRQYNPSS